jgi:hypothetical protein
MANIISAGNATNGLAISADTTGALDIKTGSGAGTTAISISSAQVVTMNGGVNRPLILGTSVSPTSSTVIDFANIPSWATRVTVLFSGVVRSTAAQGPSFQLGTGATPTYITSGYAQSGARLQQATAIDCTVNPTTGFYVNHINASGSDVLHGSAIFTNVAGTIWVCSSNFAISNSNGVFVGAGSVSIGAALTAIRISTSGGGGVYSAGTINILYE